MESAVSCWWAWASSLSNSAPMTRWGRMIPSFMARNRGSSSKDSPSRPRKTREGNGTENSEEKSTSPRSMNRSMSSFTVRATDSSMSAICRGAKIGSSSLRYFLWSGGSIWRGMRGRRFFRSTASALEEKTSGCRKTSSASALQVTTTPTPSTAMTGMVSRSILNMGCGLAAVSSSISESMPPSDSGGLSSMYAPVGPEMVVLTLILAQPQVGLRSEERAGTTAPRSTRHRTRQPTHRSC